MDDEHGRRDRRSVTGTSGFELRDALQADREIPIVFTSGHAADAAVVRAMDGGATDFLAKPFDDEKRLDAVTRSLTRIRRSRDPSIARLTPPPAAA